MIINKLTRYHLKNNKTKTISTIISIILVSILIFSIGLLFSSFRASLIQEIKISEGNYHLVIKNFTHQKELKNINYYLSKNVSIYKTKHLYKNNIQLNEADYNFFKHQYLFKGRNPKNNKEILVNKDYELDNNIKLFSFIKLDNINYKVVGITKNYGTNNTCYNIYTLNKHLKTGDTFIILPNIKNTYKFAHQYKNTIKYNTKLLSIYGIGNNSYKWLTNSLLSLLIIISICSIIVIYNSFAISYNERKKEIGIFNSIGITKWEIKKIVLYEAIIIGIFSTMIGFILSLISTNIIIKFINSVLNNQFNLSLNFHYSFIIISIIFIILIIIISAIIPTLTKKAPIILMKDNYKYKNKKIIKKINILFFLAYKNIEKNKNKYRITIISLVISIILFISVSAIAQIGGKLIKQINHLEYNIYLISPKKDDKTIKSIRIIKNIKSVSFINTYINTNKLNYTTIAQQHFKTKNFINIFAFDNSDYLKYKKQLKIKDNKYILYNNSHYISYKNNKKETININLLKSKQNITINKININNLYFTNQPYFGLKNMEGENPILIISNSMLKTLKIDNTKKVTLIKTNNYNIDKRIVNKIKNTDINYYNLNQQFLLINNIILIIKILMYIFTTMIFLISLTSVFNTIITNINLRNKEFMILQSIGVNPKELNKIISLENWALNIKAIIYSLIPTTILLIILNKYIFNNIIDEVIIPYHSFIIIIICIIFLTFIIIKYSIYQIKKYNIIETIRKGQI